MSQQQEEESTSTTLYSIASYTGDGATKNFVVPFPYLYMDNVHVYVDGEPISIYPVITEEDPFSSSPELIENDLPTPYDGHWYSANTIRLVNAPADDSIVKIQRITNRATPEVIFNDNSILNEYDLNLIATQLLYIVQEAYDAFALDYTTVQLELEQSINYARGYASDAQLAASSASSASLAAQGYAEQTSASVANASAYASAALAAKDEVNGVYTSAVTAINSATSSSLVGISAAGSSGLNALTSAASSLLVNVSAGGATVISSINNTQTSALTVISGGQTSAVNAINTAKTSGVSAVNTAKTSALTAISGAQTSAVNAISSLATEKINAIETYADDIISGIETTYETVVIQASSNIAANTIITLPKDGNNNNRTYVVGKDTFGLSWNGTDCYKGYQYEEVGTNHSVSYRVKLLFDVTAGDLLAFKFLKANISASVADVIQPDGVTINVDSNGKLAAILTDQAITNAIGYTPANDDGVVKISGSQIISGAKTFASGLTVSNGATVSGGLSVRAALNMITGNIVFSKTATISGSTVAHSCQMGMNDNSLNCGIYDNTNGKWAVGISHSGNAFATAPFTASGGLTVSSGATINGGLTVSGGITGTCTDASSLGGSAASAYAKDTEVVKLSEVQTIGGIKVFSTGLRSQTAAISIINQGITKGTTPSSNQYRYLYFFDKVTDPTASTLGTDHIMAALRQIYGNTGNNAIQLLIYQPTTGGTAYQMLSFRATPEGEYDFVPGTDSSINLGGASNRWATVYATTFSGTATNASSLGGIAASNYATTTVTSAAPTYASGFEDYNSASKVWVYRKGNVCQLRGAVKPSVATGTSSFTMFTLPEGYRPVIGLNCVQQGTGMNRFLLMVNTSGNVSVERYGTTSAATSVNSGTWLNVACTYICE